MSSAPAAAGRAAPEKFSTSAPGTKPYPTYYQKEVQQVIINAVKWAAPGNLPQITYGHKPNPLEKFG